MFLGDLSFAAVGVTTNITAFLEEIGLEPDTRVSTLNLGRYQELPTFDLEFLRDFEAENAADYALYEATAKRFS